MKKLLDYLIQDHPYEKLDALITDSDLSIIAREVDLSRPGSILGLTTQEKEEAYQGYEHRTTVQRLFIMEAWKKKKINNATYLSLIKEACKDKQAKVVLKVREILTGGHILEDEDMKTFQDYLYECYTRKLPHPSHTQWPQLHRELYVDQVLYRKQKSKESKEGTTPIQLYQIFNDPSGKVVLIEGVAGSGKSTLLWHICKQWAHRNLFKHISLVIHTSLPNWEHDVRNLADIIPHPSKKLRRNVADIITRDQGRGVCFLIDDRVKENHASTMHVFTDFKTIYEASSEQHST